MRKTLVIFAALIALTFSVNAQTPSSNETTIPEEVLDLIKRAPKKDVVSIIGKYEVNDQVIRADNLVFHNNSELVFTNYDVPYIVIAVKELKFNAPLIKSTIRLADFDVSSLKGKKGERGTNGHTRSNRDGSPGTDGTVGEKGASKAVPNLFIIVEKINTDFGELSTFDLQINFKGVQGGPGGDGGDGGDGGNATTGRSSKSNWVKCTRHAGTGGSGGASGRGGKGGEGGDGSNGAIVYLVGNESVTGRLVYARYLLDEGAEGAGGAPGISGKGGGAGAGGDGSRHCSGGNKGNDGAVLPNLGPGEKGKRGTRGEIKIIKKSLDGLF